jgi:hypothetical protein
MAELDVSGSFLITIGRGDGPETWVVVSANDEHGKPVVFNFPKNPQNGPVHVFVALSAMFGAYEIPLYIKEAQPMEEGFCGIRVETPSDFGVTLDKIAPSSLGIVVTVKKDRGQALACDCGGAKVTSWFPDKMREPR